MVRRHSHSILHYWSNVAFTPPSKASQQGAKYKIRVPGRSNVISLAPHSMDSYSPSMVRLPDLISHCPFKPVHHPNGDTLAAASEKWFADGCRVFSADMRRHLHELNAGMLAAYCYNECDDDRFRVICDFMNVTWLLDDLSDALKTKDTEILADLVMNAISFPKFYRPTRTGGKEQPEEEPDLSRLMRE
jgi:alpha-muurolene/germacrene-A/gamma-muurolene/(+)-delta-cadinol synthase